MSKKWITVSPKEIEAITEAAWVVENEGGDNSTLLSFLIRCNKTQKKITVSSAKSKGRNLQQWVCQKISELTGIPYVQSDDQCDIHSREMGQHGMDVVLRGEALKKFPYSVECKSSESLDLVGTIEQAKNNTYKGTDWLIVHKRKALASPIVIMAWEAFEKLYRREGNCGG